MLSFIREGTENERKHHYPTSQSLHMLSAQLPFYSISSARKGSEKDVNVISSR